MAVVAITYAHMAHVLMHARCWCHTVAKTIFLLSPLPSFFAWRHLGLLYLLGGRSWSREGGEGARRVRKLPPAASLGRIGGHLGRVKSHTSCKDGASFEPNTRIIDCAHSKHASRSLTYECPYLFAFVLKFDFLLDCKPAGSLESRSRSS